MSADFTRKVTVAGDLVTLRPAVRSDAGVLAGLLTRGLAVREAWLATWF
jgi:hypothetical protein